MIKSITVSVFLLCLTLKAVGQPNCNIYKWEGDTLCFRACLEATKAITFRQGSRQSQIHFDKAIALCPTFDYAYFEKAVPYLKRGDFITWKKLIDKAVELNPTQRLGYRGWCRYQFLADYKGAIQDIEQLESIIDYDIGYCQNGDYHLNIAKALCYKGIGEKSKAIQTIEKQLSLEDYSPLPYDYLHLGVLKLEVCDYPDAIVALKKQNEINPYLAENYFYLALAYKGLNDKEEYKKNLLIAREHYLKNNKRTDPYSEPMDKIYLINIENEIKKAW